MKAIKPQRLGVLTRAVTSDGRRYTLAVAGLVSVPFETPQALAMETALWQDVAEHVPGGLLDEAFAKPRAEVLTHGAAMAPGSTAVAAVKTRLRVLRDDQALIDKQLAVQGDRFWVGARSHDALAARLFQLGTTEQVQLLDVERGGDGTAKSFNATLLLQRQGLTAPQHLIVEVPHHHANILRPGKRLVLQVAHPLEDGPPDMRIDWQATTAITDMPSLIVVRCSHCGAPLQYDGKASTDCRYCGTTNIAVETTK